MPTLKTEVAEGAAGCDPATGKGLGPGRGPRRGLVLAQNKELHTHTPPVWSNHPGWCLSGAQHPCPPRC